MFTNYYEFYSHKKIKNKKTRPPNMEFIGHYKYRNYQ